MSVRDTLLIAIPFVFILMATILRLDQIIASPKEAATGRCLACGMDEHGEPILRDPDGRLSGPARRRRDSKGRAESVTAAQPSITIRRGLRPDGRFNSTQSR